MYREYSNFLFPFALEHCQMHLAARHFVVLLTYFSNYTNKKDIKVKQYKSHIKLNTEIIDFKTLLEFVENQYKNGEITEEEYKKKRTEILNQL